MHGWLIDQGTFESLQMGFGAFLLRDGANIQQTLLVMAANNRAARHE